MKNYKQSSLIAILVTVVLHVAAYLYFNISHLEIKAPYSEEYALLEIDYAEEEELEEILEKEEEQPTVENNQSLKNLMKDIQNIRKNSYSNYSEEEIEAQQIKDIEAENKKTVQELRENGLKGFDETKFDLNPTKKKDKTPTKTKGEGNNYAGNVTAVCNVPGRECYTKKPTYKCRGGGKVHIDIKVDKLGRVKSASVNPAKSSTTNECILNNALEYAKSTTRVNSDLDGKPNQQGYIIYNFISQ